MSVYLFLCLLVLSFVYPFVYLFLRSFIHPSVRLFLSLTVNWSFSPVYLSSVCPFIRLINCLSMSISFGPLTSPIYSYIDLLSCPSIHLLTANPSVYSPIHLSTQCLSIYPQSMHLSTYHLSTCLSLVYPSISLPIIYPSVYSSFISQPTADAPVYLSSFHLSTHRLSIVNASTYRLCTCLSIVYPSVYS